jgi:S1-C subfamily serine protease
MTRHPVESGHPPRSVHRVAVALLAVVAFIFAGAAASAGSAPKARAKPAIEPAAKVEATVDTETGISPSDAERLFRAIVKVHTRAVPNARSAATLGDEREGSGVVIGAGGLILTIGYLIVEADDVKITDSRGRSLPARIVGYDHATGFGLVRTVTPLDVPPVPFGESGKVAERDPVMIVNNSGADDVTLAYIVSRRLFTASWEYMLDQAIFTAPPAMNWSGAALVDQKGRLIGLGSLIVRDALAGSHTLPGNMFVPIDALKPVLADLVKTGRRADRRAMAGRCCRRTTGTAFCDAGIAGGPGDAAGIQVGDIILGVGGEGVRTQAEFYQKVWNRGPAGTDIPLRILQGIDIKDVLVHSIDRVDYFRPMTTL